MINKISKTYVLHIETLVRSKHLSMHSFRYIKFSGVSLCEVTAGNYSSKQYQWNTNINLITGFILHIEFRHLLIANSNQCMCASFHQKCIMW